MNFIIDHGDSNRKILQYLRSKTKLPITCLYRLFRQKKIQVNGKKITSDYILQEADNILLPNLNIEQRIYNNNAPNIIDIITEDENIFIINKPSGIPTQRGTNVKYSIDDCVKKYYGDYHIVHRLDKETSGVLVLAKNANIATIISRLFEKKKIKKEYLAVLCGKSEEKFEVNAPIEKISLKCIVSNNGKVAKTLFELVKYIEINGKMYSIVKIFPQTGRTHQIRVHSAYIGLPILGDQKYGGDEYFRIMLHASQINIFNNSYNSHFDDLDVLNVL